MIIKAPNITCTHAFSTRHGGVSSGAFSGMNLGGGDDSPENIQRNRTIFLSNLHLHPDQLCFLKQVHGNKVNFAAAGQQEGDALVNNLKDLVLAVSIADCYPIIFHDRDNHVIGAAHAGWRGTLSKIAEKTLEKMLELGANKKSIQVAIGQGISKEKFEVGTDVIEQFSNAGFPQPLLHNNHIDLSACNAYVLEQCGVPANNIWQMNRCTFEDDFFSYRRDKGITGRMWAVISL
jgi:YfiH family protein